MPLIPGARLGPYEVLGSLGVGGMGEVYRARDTRLKREVALKVLPDHFASDPERLARFQREAEVLASLSHPHIAGVHGLEESDGIRALVMEMVAGETLAERIARGRVPLDEAVPMAQQIADALQAAHEQGIIHRDLKPANIKITPDGTVKVLDFGLAKLTEPPGATTPAAPLSMSPTVTSPMAMTSVGVLLGTAAYMSPEQAKGRPADKRSDIWAFGCVFYEMLTGKRPFDGDDVSDTLASVLKSDPDWTSLRAEVPPVILRLIESCLAKDRRRRIADIAVAQFVLTDAAIRSRAGGAAPADAGAARRVSRRTVLTVAGAGLSGAALGGLAWWWITPPPPVLQRYRFVIRIPPGQTFSSGRQFIAISPDGTTVAYSAGRQVFIRPMDALEARSIYEVTGKGQIDPTSPVFSPDSQSIAFWAEGTVKRMPLAGGTAVPLAAVDNPLGMSWGPGDIILVGQGPKGIVRISANDGATKQIVRVNGDELAHGPHMLPGADLLLFTLAKGTGALVTRAGLPDQWNEASVVVQSLTSGMRKVVATGADARYLPTGHLVYAIGGTIYAKAFDPRTGTASDNAAPVLFAVRRSSSGITGAAQFSVSETGSLVYVQGSATGAPQVRGLVVSSQDGGSRQRLQVDAGPYFQVRASPDGKHIAYGRDDDQEAAIWVFTLGGEAVPKKLTFDGHSRYPVWSPDNRIAFQTERNGDRGIFWQPATGGPVEMLTKAADDEMHIPESFSPDGKQLLFSIFKDSVYSLYLMTLANKKPVRFGDLKSVEPFGAVISPDGRWLAYFFSEGNEAAKAANRGVYVQAFPTGGTPYLLPKSSRDYHPAWSPDSRRIYYVPTALGRFVAVDMLQNQGEFGKPIELPQVPRPGVLSGTPRAYDVFRDGRFKGQFICLIPEADLAEDSASQSQEVRVVIDWFDELRRLVPTR